MEKSIYGKTGSLSAPCKVSNRRARLSAVSDNTGTKTSLKMSSTLDLHGFLHLKQHPKLLAELPELLSVSALRTLPDHGISWLWYQRQCFVIAESALEHGDARNTVSDSVCHVLWSTLRQEVESTYHSTAQDSLPLDDP